MNIQAFQFPPKHPRTTVQVLCIALAANGTSSYRDASAIASITSTKWNAHVTILTDNKSKLLALPSTTTVSEVRSKKSLLSCIRGFIQTRVLSGTSLFVSISSHGYSMSVPERRALEMNGRSEYVVIAGQRVMDYELFDALYTDMPLDIPSLCLVDTCHSGTMLDLEYVSTDGRVFHRSQTPLQSRPFSVCISACSDSETAGEDISSIGGWGGKLTCQFVDYVNTQTTVHALTFYKMVLGLFSSQRTQRSHPIISYNCS